MGSDNGIYHPGPGLSVPYDVFLAAELAKGGDVDKLKIRLAAKEIKTAILLIRSGGRDLEQGLIDIAREAEFILRQAAEGPDQAAGDPGEEES